VKYGIRTSLASILCLLQKRELSLKVRHWEWIVTHILCRDFRGILEAQYNVWSILLHKSYFWWRWVGPWMSACWLQHYPSGYLVPLRATSAKHAPVAMQGMVKQLAVLAAVTEQDTWQHVSPIVALYICICFTKLCHFNSYTRCNDKLSLGKCKRSTVVTNFKTILSVTNEGKINIFTTMR
jgi:hypothetical protein